MRVLAVDFGEKRIGLAISDETGRVVVPVGTVPRKNDVSAARDIAAAAKEREVARIVVGLPVNLDGGEGAWAERVRKFARRLREVSGLPVDLHAGLGPRRREAARDAEAAAVLLRDYFFERDEARGAS